MPTYQYACTACDEQLEVHQKFTDESLTECPACEGRLRKVFNAVGVVFKGSGFYKTDSRAATGAGKGSGSGSGNGSGDSGSGSGSASESGKDSAGSGSSTGTSGDKSGQKSSTGTSGDKSSSGSSGSAKSSAA